MLFVQRSIRRITKRLTMSTTPQPNLPSVEEVVEAFDAFLEKYTGKHETTFELAKILYADTVRVRKDLIVKEFTQILTARDAAHKEAMGEMDEVFIIFLNRVLRDKTDPRIIAAIVEDLREEIARSRGVEDKQ
jgi:hypothetical protein